MKQHKVNINEKYFSNWTSRGCQQHLVDFDTKVLYEATTKHKSSCDQPTVMGDDCGGGSTYTYAGFYLGKAET